MMKTQKYNYQLKTLSALVLSPREHGGYYFAAGDFKKEDLVFDTNEDSNKINILYPFYQYGSYDRYNPKAEYFIPGSSVKGAVKALCKSKTWSNMMVDDIPVAPQNIVLRSLYKVQHVLDQEGKGRIERFFPNVAVEMLKAGVQCEGELYANQDLTSMFQEAHECAINRLEEWGRSVRSMKEQMSNQQEQECLEEINQHVKNLLVQQEKHQYLITLGGYKGLVLSGIIDPSDAPGVSYVDMQTKLPHGLVIISFE